MYQITLTSSERKVLIEALKEFSNQRQAEASEADEQVKGEIAANVLERLNQ